MTNACREPWPIQGKQRCDWCNDRVDGTPWAFVLTDLRFPEGLRFCSERCLRKYERKYGQPTQTRQSRTAKARNTP